MAPASVARCSTTSAPCPHSQLLHGGSTAAFTDGGGCTARPKNQRAGSSGHRPTLANRGAVAAGMPNMSLQRGRGGGDWTPYDVGGLRHGIRCHLRPGWGPGEAVPSRPCRVGRLARSAAAARQRTSGGPEEFVSQPMGRREGRRGGDLCGWRLSGAGCRARSAMGKRVRRWER
jgi:hypothetical protein